MTTITYIFRDPKKGGYSIEELFKGIIINLPEEFMVKTFYYKQTEPLWKNIIRLRSIRTDIYHITGDVNFLALFIPGRKTILTLHDLGHYKNLRGWRKIIYGLLWILLPLSRSKISTCVSSYTYSDIRNFFPLFTKAIKIISNPVPILFKHEPLYFNAKKPRILTIGTGPHKNLATLFKALEGIPCEVAIVGPMNISLKASLEQHKIDFVNHINLSQQEVYEQYVQSDLVSFVTTHEGFGMPILEAQAVGRPVLTSNICSLPEVAGDTAAMIDDPMDVSAIRNTILRIINEPAFRNKLIEKGSINIRRFEMKKIVQEYISIYQSLLL